MSPFLPYLFLTHLLTRFLSPFFVFLVSFLPCFLSFLLQCFHDFLFCFFWLVSFLLLHEQNNLKILNWKGLHLQSRLLVPVLFCLSNNCFYLLSSYHKCFRAKSGNTTFTVFFAVYSLKKMRFGENQFVSPKRTIFEVVASQSVAHRNRSDFCDLRLRCPSRTPEIAISETRVVRGKRSHRARNPRKFKVTKKYQKNHSGGRPQSSEKITKNELKSNFSPVFVTVSLLFRYFRVYPQSYFFATFSLLWIFLGFGLCGTFCPSQDKRQQWCIAI